MTAATIIRYSSPVCPRINFPFTSNYTAEINQEEYLKQTDTINSELRQARA
jgi:hypothetical protein